MINTSKQIRKTITNLWPIRDIWLVDPKYFLLDIDVVDQIIKELSNKKLEFIDNVWDCDNYSLLLNAEFKKYQYDCLTCSGYTKVNYTWAFGQCLAKKVKGIDTNHAINIAVCKQGVYLIEPQNDDIWKVDKNKDELYFFNDVEGGIMQVMQKKFLFILIFSIFLFNSCGYRFKINKNIRDPIRLAEGTEANAKLSALPELATTPADSDEFLINDGGTSKKIQYSNLGIGTSFDSTTIDNTTWSDGANASNTWTFNVSGSDHTMIASSGQMTFSSAVKANTLVMNLLTTSGGDMDYGEGGITDHTFITDAGTLIIDASIQFPDINVSPSAIGEFLYDNTVAGLEDGALCWYDDDAIRYLVDLDTLPSNDDYVVTYDADADKFYMSAAGTGDIVSVLGVSSGAVDILRQDPSQFVASDTNPDVSASTYWKTNGVITFDGFDGSPESGQQLWIRCDDDVTFDITTTNIICNNRITDYVVDTTNGPFLAKLSYDANLTKWDFYNAPNAIVELDAAGYFAGDGSGGANERTFQNTTTLEWVNANGVSGNSSAHVIKEAGWTITDSDTATEVADGVQALVIPASLVGMELVDVTASVHDLNSASGGTTTIVIRRVRGNTPADMTSTGVTIDYDEYTASDEAVDIANDDLALGDKIYPDVNTITTGAAQKGLSVTVTFKTP